MTFKILFERQKDRVCMHSSSNGHSCEQEQAPGWQPLSALPLRVRSSRKLESDQGIKARYVMWNAVSLLTGNLTSWLHPGPFVDTFIVGHSAWKFFTYDIGTTFSYVTFFIICASCRPLICTNISSSFIFILNNLLGLILAKICTVNSMIKYSRFRKMCIQYQYLLQIHAQ